LELFRNFATLHPAQQQQETEQEDVELPQVRYAVTSDTELDLESQEEDVSVPEHGVERMDEESSLEATS
jgi:hypothetical protein